MPSHRGARAHSTFPPRKAPTIVAATTPPESSDPQPMAGIQRGKAAISARSLPVLVNAENPWPGTPLPPWPPAVAVHDYVPPAGRGVARLVQRDGFGRCPSCQRSIELRSNGTVINHKSKNELCVGSQKTPASLPALASWLFSSQI